MPPPRVAYGINSLCVLDQGRLPAYSRPSSVHRFHPYRRLEELPPPYCEEPCLNTIYDDEYEPLEVPARVPRTAEEEAEERLMFLSLVESIARIQRVLKVMPSFFDGLKRGAQESMLPFNHLTTA